MDQPRDEHLRWHCIDASHENECENGCPVRSVLTLFGKKNAMSILRQLLANGTLRFNEIHERVGGHPKTLQTRLKDLAEFGLVIRKQFNEIPPRVEYSLTEAGKALEDIFERISLWTGRWRSQLPST